MSDVTIIVPVANYHKDVMQRAVTSANEQTVPCEVFVYEDTEMRGAGFARNKALAEVDTKFVVFLDADDQISPVFVEHCMSVWKPGHYVYTDFYMDGAVVLASKQPWQATNGEWHVITTLIRTDDIRKIGGFNEEVAGAEDSLMYWALTRSGVCGIALHEPLFTYGKEGRRAKAFVESAAYRPTMLGLIERYGDEMCCGGDNPIKSFVPDQPGDVHAMALWGGNRRVLGVVSGRLYARSSFPHTLSVDPRDVDARPDEWQRVQPPAPPPVQAPQMRIAPLMPKAEPTRVYNGAAGLVEAVHGVRVPQEPATVMTASELQATLPPEIKANVPANVSKVRKLAKGKQ